MNLENMPILNGLIKYANEDIIPFHMPGHKNNKRSFEELELIRKNLYRIDNTEVPGLDNLHIPEEMILESEVLAAEAFKAVESYYLVNGSTCGIYSMIMGLTEPSNKIIVQRNCHRSVFMACLMGDLNVVYVDTDIIEDFNIAAGVPIQNIINIMDENMDAKAIVVTNPSYYGICSNMESLINEAHKRNILVLVDEAHGAHLPFNKRLPKCAMECGADASVVSLHKSLPALTQTSLLNVGKNIDTTGIKFMLRLFQSTSPSYVLMASIDAARKIMVERGENLLDEVIYGIEQFKNKLESLKGYKILDKHYIGKESIFDIDITKIIISSPMGGRVLEKKLRDEYHIQVEMSDLNNIVLIASVGDTLEFYERLYEALKGIEQEIQETHVQKAILRLPKHITYMNIREAYYNKKKLMDLKSSLGYVSGEMVVPYPPGIPILLPGEVITSDIIEYMMLMRENNVSLNGINDTKGETILVIDK